jgi:hypothetical protein
MVKLGSGIDHKFRLLRPKYTKVKGAFTDGYLHADHLQCTRAGLAGDSSICITDTSLEVIALSTSVAFSGFFTICTVIV